MTPGDTDHDGNRQGRGEALPQAALPLAEALPSIAQLPPGNMFGRALAGAYGMAQPMARRLLPRSVRKHFVGLVSLVERLTQSSLEESFSRRSVPLAKLPPLREPHSFDGPTVLVNNALAWGGVERQVVYTLSGLAERKVGPLGLLCIRLGIDQHHDFFRGALSRFPGFIRNVLPPAEAGRIIADRISPEQRDAIADCVGWMPHDAQEEIWRFMADFLVLKPGVVHVWQDALSISVGYAAHLAGVPRIIIAGRNVAPVNFGYHRAHMGFAYRELAACDRLTMLNNSEEGARSYAQWLSLPVSRFHVLRNGIDAGVISPPARAEVDALRERLGVPNGAPVVGSIFRFYNEKRPLLWVKAAATIARSRPDAHFVVFGTGPMREKMLKRARRDGFEHRLHLPGTIADPSLGLGLLDVFMLTSEFEGTPNVVLEAGLLGVPVVAADAGGAAETICHGETGFVVYSGQPADLGLQALAILDDPSFRARVAEAGPRFVTQRFGLERMIDETLALYGSNV